MREIFNQNDFAEMLSQDKVVLSFYHDWSKYSVDGIKYLKESENFFQTKEVDLKINFWFADVSGNSSPANFLVEWIKENTSNQANLFQWIAAGNSSVIWLSFGQILLCEFSAYHLKSEGIIEKTNEIFRLQTSSR